MSFILTYGKYESSIKTTESAVIIPQKVILAVCFILTAGYQVAAHTLAAAIGAYKTLTNIARAAAAVSAVAAVRIILPSLLARGILHGVLIFRV